MSEVFLTLDMGTRLIKQEHRNQTTVTKMFSLLSETFRTVLRRSSRDDRPYPDHHRDWEHRFRSDIRPRRGDFRFDPNRDLW